jgi:integrase
MASIHKLTARKVETAKPGQYGDGAGLWLVVDATGAKRWIYRFQIGGKASSMGLGAVRDVSLPEARAKAQVARAAVRSGRNPVEAKKAAQREAQGATFGQVGNSIIEARAPNWRGASTESDWRRGIEIHAASLRDMPMDEIDTAAVLRVLQPIWLTKPVMAARLRGMIEATLDAARALGKIDENRANPARWRGHLDKLLAKPKRLKRGHHPAIPYDSMPEFVSELRARSAVSARALEFQILTATRPGEAIGAKFNEIDFAKSLWTIPRERMKADKAHVVPLCRRAVEIVKEMRRQTNGEYIFPGRISGQHLNDNMPCRMADRLWPGSSAHGMRSSFRDFAGDETHFAREVAEAALAHVVGDKAEQAYRRGDALQKRRELMDAWARYCEPKEDGVADILKFPKGGAA